MQVMFFLALMGLIISSIAGLISSVTFSSMTHKLNQIELQKEVFQDVEFVVNNLILSKYSDLKAFDNTINTSNTSLSNSADHILSHEDLLSVIASSSAWTEDNLTLDPWGKEIKVISAQCNTNIGGAGAVAPVVAFALISYGPDRQLKGENADVAGVETLGQNIRALASRNEANCDRNRAILALAAIEDTDDIVHTFSTKPAADELWNDLKAMMSKVESLAMFHYRQQIISFQPRLQQFYDDNSDAFVNASTLSNATFDTAWMHGSSALGVSALPISTSGYPVMSEDLKAIGANVEVKNVVPELGITIRGDGCTNAITCKRMFVQADSLGASGWSVTYQTMVDGERLFRK